MRSEKKSRAAKKNGGPGGPRAPWRGLGQSPNLSITEKNKKNPKKTHNNALRVARNSSPSPCPCPYPNNTSLEKRRGSGALQKGKAPSNPSNSSNSSKLFVINYSVPRYNMQVHIGAPPRVVYCKSLFQRDLGRCRVSCQRIARGDDPYSRLQTFKTLY